MACHGIITCPLVPLSAIFITICLHHVNSAEVRHQEYEEFHSLSEPSEFKSKSIIVLTSTFAIGLLVGALWCYCMSAVCKTRQSDYKQLRLSAPPQRHHFIQESYPQLPQPGYALDPLTPSDISTRTPSPLP